MDNTSTQVLLYAGLGSDNVDTIYMGAGTGGAGWASAHPGKNQGGHGPPWKF